MPGPAVNVVTTISSKLSAKASRAPATSEERSSGKVMCRNVVKRAGAEVGRGLPRRAAEPAQAGRPTLLKTTTMQNVAWPTMIVKSPALMPNTGSRKPWIVDCRATPVTMPGSAIGRTTST